jgi:peptide-methionine (S)-S-oxide reductase
MSRLIVDDAGHGEAMEQSNLPDTVGTDTATIAGGCFWCIEAVFERVEGVSRLVSGYTGGHVDNPTYEQVCTGLTGHAEVVQVTFLPDTISFQEILKLFFVFHNPTTLNRQDPDVGPQYRSAVFYDSPRQKEECEEVIGELVAENAWPNPIVTEVAPLGVFFAAEDYHQQYYERNPNAPYCRVIIDPKVTKLRERYAAKLKSD